MDFNVIFSKLITLNKGTFIPLEGLDLLNNSILPREFSNTYKASNRKD